MFEKVYGFYYFTVFQRSANTEARTLDHTFRNLSQYRLRLYRRVIGLNNFHSQQCSDETFLPITEVLYFLKSGK